MRSKLRRQKNSRRPVGSADNPDRTRFLQREAKQIVRANRGDKDPHLCRRSEKERDRPGQQQTEIRERTNAEKDDGRQQFGFDADVIDQLQQRHVVPVTGETR